MKILVINAGSSSLKYQLIDMDGEQVAAKGLVERIGIPGSQLKHEGKGDEVVIETQIPDHIKAIQLVLDALLNPDHGVVNNLNEIGAVGHRVVHGGEDFSASALIDGDVLEAIRWNSDLAPLHNPANIMGIEACMAAMPGVPQVAVFDTAFHAKMPQKAYLYGLPNEVYTDYKVRRYGFHGTSHLFISKRAAELMGKESSKIITCHLGNGCSIAAVENGISVDTSMGLTPLEGVVMGTRSGDIDPAILQYLMGKLGLTIDGMTDYLNKKSGMLGLSGVSSDFRDIAAAAADGNQWAEVALEVYAYRVAKYIGSYAAAMNGVDGIVFTAGVGENDSGVRANILSYLGYLGVEVDDAKNALRGENKISTDQSKVAVYVIPTNEELVIARDTLSLV
ncbi:acetate kinase [Eubacteriales bacterium OttesenSCG-928-M02]|nr:acetate kinase [Eubacteriales bacterium OttesenSCG-928-M02]